MRPPPPTGPPGFVGDIGEEGPEGFSYDGDLGTVACLLCDQCVPVCQQ